MLNEIISFAILVIFAVLLVVGAVSTVARVLRYHRAGYRWPVLLGRDRDLLIGLAIPFVLIATVRAFELQPFITDLESGQPHIWWLLLTGLPPIYALARYDYFELFVIERSSNVSDGPETAIQQQDRIVGDERRRLQEKDGE